MHPNMAHGIPWDSRSVTRMCSMLVTTHLVQHACKQGSSGVAEIPSSDQILHCHYSVHGAHAAMMMTPHDLTIGEMCRCFR